MHGIDTGEVLACFVVFCMNLQFTFEYFIQLKSHKRTTKDIPDGRKQKLGI